MNMKDQYIAREVALKLRQNPNTVIKPQIERNTMLREYFIIGRYIASVPEREDFEKFILDEVERDFASVNPASLRSFIDSLFSVIQGEEMDDYEEDDE